MNTTTQASAKTPQAKTSQTKNAQGDNTEPFNLSAPTATSNPYVPDQFATVHPDQSAPAVPSNPAEKRTDVLYISTHVFFGGMSIAANRIHMGLRSIGINSKMLVMRKDARPVGKDAEIHAIELREGEAWTPYYDVHLTRPYKNALKYRISAATKGVDINSRIEAFDPKIVQLHWICHNYIKIEDLAKIKRKIVWRLADCWPFTGGCFYTDGCERYTGECGKCHLLRSADEQDITRQVMRRKQEALKDLDMTIVVPTHWLREMAERSTLFKDRRIVVIPNGLDLNVFYPEDKIAARKAFGIPLDKKIILFGAGRVSFPRKGFHLLCEAMRELIKTHGDEYHMVVFGGDSRRMKLDIPATALGYIGKKSALRTLYSAADVMIVPSLEESFGQTVTEAMACATPVVSFEETGPASAIDHKENGYLAKYADAGDLARGIEWVLADEERLGMLAANARHKIETTYDIRVVAEQYHKLYNEILGEEIMSER